MILDDVLQEGLLAVFCGTAASSASARRRAYYAGPGNRFWDTLFEVGLTPRRFQPEEFPELLVLGLGLTDLSKGASGSDAQIAPEDYDVAGFWVKMQRWRPRVIVFTSKAAAQRALGRKKVDYGPTVTAAQVDVFVLPSPSGAARGAWDVQWWWRLANRLKIWS